MDSVITPEDEAFANAFHHGKITNEAFHHRDHLRLAWIAIRRVGVERATQSITHLIRHFAASHAGESRYNETMTRFWLWAVDRGIRADPELGFEALLDAEPHLLDKSLPFSHWSKEQLHSQTAKGSWIEPDLLALPA